MKGNTNDFGYERELRNSKARSKRLISVFRVTASYPLISPLVYSYFPNISLRGAFIDSTDVDEQFRFQDKLALLVLFAHLVRLIVLPAHDFLALSAANVADDVAARRHITLHRVRLLGVDNGREEVRFAMLASEVPADDVLVVGQVGLALSAPVDALRVEVNVVGQTHLSQDSPFPCAYSSPGGNFWLLSFRFRAVNRCFSAVCSLAL